jgi:hypothetical protein
MGPGEDGDGYNVNRRWLASRLGNGRGGTECSSRKRERETLGQPNTKNLTYNFDTINPTGDRLYFKGYKVVNLSVTLDSIKFWNATSTLSLRLLRHAALARIEVSTNTTILNKSKPAPGMDESESPAIIIGYITASTAGARLRCLFTYYSLVAG